MKKLLIFFLLLPLTAAGQLKISLGADSPLRKLQIAHMAVENLYVDSVDANAVAENAIRGMREKLDRHSSFTTGKETRELNEP
ncbi:MAG: peptidase S41, partial [Prevotella sp.]|nr:peptidase S41 [Prevotella sp.]